MNTVAGIVIVVIGILVMTPAGAAWVARYNRRNAAPSTRQQMPRTVRGAQAAGIFVIAVGIVFILS